jgi:hypothetical protein
MNMPGFTAEISLHPSRVYYQATTGFHRMAYAGIVSPQLPVGFCQANCDRIGDPFMRSVCELRCLDSDGGGGGGGGGGQVCRPSCGRCLPDPDSRTGKSKLCMLRNCDTVDRAC